MDESSRNVVKFIGAGTGAILLLMAAWFYAQAGRIEPAPTVAEADTTADNAPIQAASASKEPVAAPLAENSADDPYAEEIEPISGAPSMPTAETNPGEE